ncbi:MAG: methyltransferase domain-containing protein [Candidatus Dadabacteria bacterium]|nr:MAG: methyltransferase domain-containing protein [Candidatus Dadabacteria bacterium]
MLIKMIKHHGLKNGLRRFKEEIFENRLFDLRYGVETAGILTHNEYYNHVGQDKSAGAMWYQPTYASPLVKTFTFLKKRELPADKTILFIDLGVGKGKPCIIAAKQLKDCRIVGVDLSSELLSICESNLKACGVSNFKLIQQNVLEVDFNELFDGFDTVIVHNKNSFDKAITGKTLASIEGAKAGKTVYYIYNNPVYRELFEGKELLFQLNGWHKNHVLHLYRL